MAGEAVIAIVDELRRDHSYVVRLINVLLEVLNHSPNRDAHGSHRNVHAAMGTSGCHGGTEYRTKPLSALCPPPFLDVTTAAHVLRAGAGRCARREPWSAHARPPGRRRCDAPSANVGSTPHPRMHTIMWCTGSPCGSTQTLVRRLGCTWHSRTNAQYHACILIQSWLEFTKYLIAYRHHVPQVPKRRLAPCSTSALCCPQHCQ